MVIADVLPVTMETHKNLAVRAKCASVMAIVSIAMVDHGATRGLDSVWPVLTIPMVSTATVVERVSSALRSLATAEVSATNFDLFNAD